MQNRASATQPIPPSPLMPDLPDLPRTEAAIIEMTNAFRHGEKLPAVKANAELTATARLFAQYLAKSGRFAHEADGRQPGDRAKASGYKFCMIAENLASHLDSRGFTSKGLAGLAVEGWKNSPPHRKNLVQPDVTEIGVGIAKAPDADPKFISVQLFGRPEALKYQFKIENNAGVMVSYTALGTKHSVDPRVIVTHSGCLPGDIVFERSGNWLTGARIESQFQARDGAVFTLTSGPDQRIRIDVK